MRPTETNGQNVDERKTKELCGHEHDGRRCMRAKGHRTEHAAYTVGEIVTWTD